MDKGLYKYNSMSNSAIVNGELISNIWWGHLLWRDLIKNLIGGTFLILLFLKE